jgi:hypothetical protein
MKARARTALTTLALLAAAAGALLYAWYGVERKGEAEARKKEQEQRLFSFEAKDVKELLVEAKGGSTRLVRQGDGWQIPALGEAADRASADAAAERLAGAKRRSEIPGAPDQAALAGYGLARPRIRVEASLEGGRKESLALGDKSAFDGSIYGRAGTGPVLVLAGDIEWALDKGTEDLRDRTLLHFETDQVKALRAEAGGKVAWAVERLPAKDGAAEGWSLTQPRAARAQAGKIAGALQALAWLRALRFADDGGKRAPELGFAPPRRSFVLLGDGGKELGRIDVGKEANDSTYARSSASPRILEVDKAAFSRVPERADDLEEKPEPAAGAAPPAQARATPAPGSPAAAPSSPPGAAPAAARQGTAGPAKH